MDGTNPEIIFLYFITRYAWSHGITPRHHDTLPVRVVEPASAQSGLTLVSRDTRVSLTFRSARAECAR